MAKQAERLTTKQKTGWCDKGKQQIIESIKGVAMEQFKIWAVGPDGNKGTMQVKAESREAGIRKVEAKGYIVKQAELQPKTPQESLGNPAKQKERSAFQNILNPYQSDNHQSNTEPATENVITSSALTPTYNVLAIMSYWLGILGRMSIFFAALGLLFAFGKGDVMLGITSVSTILSGILFYVLAEALSAFRDIAINSWHIRNLLGQSKA
jgi:hypothetical protein